MAEWLARHPQMEDGGLFAVADPPGASLKSGGATAHVIAEYWKAQGSPGPFAKWLSQKQLLIVHGGGDNRRLPAYAPSGKPFIPIPVFRWSRGQRLDQSLLDLLLPLYHRILQQAGSDYAALVGSGDILFRLPNELPQFPNVDVLGLGLWQTPEKAAEHGVFFSPRQRPKELAFYLQKPAAEKIRKLNTDYVYLVDTGIWLLGHRALRSLMQRCGWRENACSFKGGCPGSYDLYGQFGLALGSSPAMPDDCLKGLTSAVVPLAGTEFFHFGTSRQLVTSVSGIQNVELDETKLGLMGARRHPDQYLQNAHFEFPLRQEQNHTLWAENCSVPASWKLACGHVLTGIPENNWDLHLEPGVCLDFVSVGGRSYAIRAYGIDDLFEGRLGEGATWFCRPALNWFKARNISLEDAGLDGRLDIQDSKIFPVVRLADLSPRFLEWLFAEKPVENDAFVRMWLSAQRLSATELVERANLQRLFAQRESFREECLQPMLRNSRYSVFFKLDLESTARLYAASRWKLPGRSETSEQLEPLQQVHDLMFRSAVLRHRRKPDWRRFEEAAFARLREMIVREAQLSPVKPVCRLQEDQIVWGRSPVRLDLAGGWTDTPPYCLEYGGRVVNVAVDLNGQPPIQVFAKLSKRPEIVLRSIDLGREERIRTYGELEEFGHLGSEFALAKAAFALAGFLPRFCAGGGETTLKKQLEAFGGGIEVSLLAAVPKGSGLGTSSILAATLLATLSDMCGLNWDRNILFARTLALEQMLTSGGGWQDQAGAIYRAVKLIETGQGLEQKPTLRWLPSHLFSHEYANKTVLLYYTGVTRLAQNILREIVRGIFLNSPSHLRIVGEIGLNAIAAFNAIQKCDYDDLAAAVRASWRLNQELDSGTNPPQIQGILDKVKDYYAAVKLLGAGGGGYLLFLAKDEDAAVRLQKTLLAHPSNNRARFVQFSLSETGLQITRS